MVPYVRILLDQQHGQSITLLELGHRRDGRDGFSDALPDRLDVSSGGDAFWGVNNQAIADELMGGRARVLAFPRRCRFATPIVSLIDLDVIYQGCPASLPPMAICFWLFPLCSARMLQVCRSEFFPQSQRHQIFDQPASATSITSGLELNLWAWRMCCSVFPPLDTFLDIHRRVSLQSIVLSDLV